MDTRTAAAATPRMGAVATKRHAATDRSTTVFTMRRQPVCFIVVDLESAGPNMTPRWVWHQGSCLSPLGYPALFVTNHQEALSLGSQWPWGPTRSWPCLHTSLACTPCVSRDVFRV